MLWVAGMRAAVLCCSAAGKYLIPGTSQDLGLEPVYFESHDCLESVLSISDRVSFMPGRVCSKTLFCCVFWHLPVKDSTWVGAIVLWCRAESELVLLQLVSA